MYYQNMFLVLNIKNNKYIKQRVYKYIYDNFHANYTYDYVDILNEKGSLFTIHSDDSPTSFYVEYITNKRLKVDGKLLSLTEFITYLKSKM